MSKINIKSVYDLPGGSIVEVHKPFSDKYYGAIVKLDGRYPSEGKVARDINREEYISIIEGEFSIYINNNKNHLKKGESILIKDGDRYWIEGNGTSLVLVMDSDNGASVEEDL